MFACFFRVLIVCSVLFSFNLSAADQERKLSNPVKKELHIVHHMGQIIDVLRSEAADRMWPGFRLHGPAIVTFQNGHVLAFHLKSQDPVWHKLSVNGQTALLSETDKWGVLKSPLNQAFPIEEQEAYIFGFEAFEQDPFLPFLVFVHERFHQYQFSHFSEDANAINHISYEDHTNAENLALIKMEEAVLVDFLDALKKQRPKSTRVAILKRFAAINTMRARLLAPQSLKWEKLQQQMEGMADYVSIKLLDTYPIIAKFDPLDHMQRLLKNYLSDSRVVEEAVQWRHYGVGAVLGYALDDLDLPHWKETVALHGKGLADLLCDTLGLSESEIQQLADSAKQDYDYAGVRKNMDGHLDRYRKNIAFLEQKFTEMKGVVVSISKPRGKELSGGGRVAQTFQLANGQSVSVMCSSTAVLQDSSWELSFDSLPLLFQNRAGDQEFKAEPELMLFVDGKEISAASIVDGELERSFRSISWTGGCSSFLSENLPGAVSGKGGKLSITFQNVD